ncbi:MAG: transporter substrate-binding domain-containing protein, partial [Spirochaetales bacterium]|nr:transporter substrate-binding domain-containing protein [Spirochaetales bacterium]
MTVTRTFILFFLMITSVIPAREGESNEPRRVRIGLFTFAPLNYTDEFGRAEGLFPALIDEFVKSSGWRVSYTEGSWFDLKEKLQRGEIDLVMGIGKTPEREKTMDFNREPVVELWGQIFIPPDSEIRTMKDLDGTAIALISNDRNSRNIVQTARESGISVRTVTYNSIEAVMEALENSEVQALAAPEYAGLQELRAYNLIGSNILFSPFSIYFAVKKGTNGHILEDIDRDMELWKGDSSSIYYRILKEQMGFHQTGRDELPLWIRFTIPLLILGILTFLIISIYLKETIIRRTAEIRNSEFNYNNLVQQLEAAVLRVDSDGGIIMINSYALGLLEVSRDELDGANVFDLNLLPTALSPAELNGNIPWKDMETISCVSAPRGALYFKWSINNVVTRGENGENPRHETLCIGIDISDQLNTEKALRSSETRFQSFMSNIPMFAYIKDENGAPVFFNRALKQLLGDGEEIQSRQKDFIPDSEPRKELKEAEQKILKGESGTEKLEYEVQLPSEKTPR